MTRRLRTIALFASSALVLVGCGSSAPEHQEKPMTAPPAHQASDFDKLTTPEAKIQYIENSNAPKAEKDRAIQMIKSGKM